MKGRETAKHTANSEFQAETASAKTLKWPRGWQGWNRMMASRVECEVKDSLILFCPTIPP